jgi:hypothetical protein
MTKLSLAQGAKVHRMARILAEAEDRYRSELMDADERLEVLDRIKRLRSAVETAKETVDAVHSGLERP